MTEVRRVASVASTMAVAHEMARQNSPHGAAVLADEQDGARGTRGRHWSSGQGGIWLSIVLHPPAGARLELLSLRIGMVVASAMEVACQKRVTISLKWPNDLCLGGQKLGGVLCEAHWRGTRCQWIVAGVGVNVANHLPDSLHGIATRLADHLPDHPPLETLQMAVLTALRSQVRWQPELSARELADWDARDVLRGTRITAPLAGVASGVSPTGALRVLADDGQLHEAVAGVARNDD